MDYSTGCGCAPAAPKAIKTVSVQPMAPTEEIVCPDARCLPHMLNSLPETDDAVASYVGVYKGRAYIAPIRALVASVLGDVQNAQYREGLVPTVTDYRDIESLPVVQKGNCSKTGIAAMPTIAKAMTEALPAAPANYEPSKVMTTDAKGDVYLATALQVVAPALVPAMVENCNKGTIANVSVVDRVLAFGSKCGDFGYATLAQLQSALAKVVPLATPATLPTYLRGFMGAGDEERKYPVTVSKQLTSSMKLTIAQDLATQWKGQAQLLQPGIYAITANFSGNVTGTTGNYSNIVGALVTGTNGKSNVASVTFGANMAGRASTGVQVVNFVKISTPTQVAVSLASGTGFALPFDGWVDVDVMQLSELNLAINGVF